MINRDSCAPANAISIMGTIALLLALTACKDEARPVFASNAAGYHGELLATLHSGSATKSQSAPHQLVLVNNQDHDVMEDNDLRGFLDGNFKWGWNQSGQVHLRLGRRGSAPRYGEYELFRNLYRWNPPPLPEHSVIVGSSMTIFVENPAAIPLKVYLYQVKKDWNPGNGGSLGNNNSPPEDGEVWWRDVAHNQQGWGLPGAGYASDTDPLADTPAMPLAETDYQPGDSHLEFSSPALTSYINDQAQLQAPFLFLLKLSDLHEDIPGAQLELFSGDSGDDRNSARRPSLTVQWQATDVFIEKKYDVRLEYGRDYTFPKLYLDSSAEEYLLATTFRDAENDLPPTIEYRYGTSRQVTPWQSANPVIAADAEWVQLRLRAVHDPVLLGDLFSASLTDTWVITAAPEEQQVPWYFRSPGGETYEVLASYAGDYRWSVSFEPTELGRWQYYWKNNFSTGYLSAPGTFDVIIGNQNNAVSQLDAFAHKLSAHPADAPDELEVYMYQFAKLERSVMRLLDPSTYRSETGLEIREKMNEIRGLLGEQPPERIPLKPSLENQWTERNTPQ
ncbi:MAG: hypothetical protein HKO55_01915 [Gammaproteobacteria bacterium]|nr:hypothetical protein [Gammaproteobacteria bacterium]